MIADLTKLLHVLIAGATGSGKSVCINTLICSMLYRAKPDEVKLLMIDPKRVELAVYDGIPHLITPVVTDPKLASNALRWAVKEMEARYKKFSDAGVRNIDGYNRGIESGAIDDEAMPYLVVIIDELADLMLVAGNEVEDNICRLAQMARAAGIHLVIATQRPSVDVITGLIKANVPSRISFAVSSGVDSRTILDMMGAERLIGKGDMLYFPIGANKPLRAQGAWISDKEVQAVVNFWKKQGEPNYAESVTEVAKGRRAGRGGRRRAVRRRRQAGGRDRERLDFDASAAFSHRIRTGGAPDRHDGASGNRRTLPREQTPGSPPYHRRPRRGRRLTPFAIDHIPRKQVSDDGRARSYAEGGEGGEGHLPRPDRRNDQNSTSLSRIDRGGRLR